MRIQRADARLAQRQARWIAGIDPWRSMGYQVAPLGRWLLRSAKAGQVLVAGKEPLGIVVVQPDVLLGDFIALVAVRPEAAGRGVGRALIAHVEQDTFGRRRWLYVSSDTSNRAAAIFYRKLGFTRVARLPGMVRAGRVEVLWRKERPGPG